MYPVYLKKKMSVVLVYIPCPDNVSLNLLEEQLHKDSKLEIMTNVGKSHLYINKKSNACANSFGRDVFTFYLNSCF